MIYRFTEITYLAYRQAGKLILKIFEYTKDFPKDYKYTLGQKQHEFVFGYHETLPDIQAAKKNAVQKSKCKVVESYLPKR